METRKTSAADAEIYYLQKYQPSTIENQTIKQVDEVLSLSEDMDEMCFSTDGSNPDDLRETEKAEEDKDECTLSRAELTGKIFSLLNNSLNSSV